MGVGNGPGDAEVEELAANDTQFDPVAIALVSNEHALRVAQLEQSHQNNLEVLRSVITTSIEAYKASLLVNGGAAVALLAFIGHAVSIGVGQLPNARRGTDED